MYGQAGTDFGAGVVDGVSFGLTSEWTDGWGANKDSGFHTAGEISSMAIPVGGAALGAARYGDKAYLSGKGIKSTIQANKAAGDAARDAIAARTG